MVSIPDRIQTASPTASLVTERRHSPTRFPSFLRARVQDGLTVGWTIAVPPLQTASAAQLAADTLSRVLGKSLPRA